MTLLSDNRKHCVRCGRILNKSFYSENHGPYGPICLQKAKKEMKNQEKIVFESNYYTTRWEDFKNEYGLIEVENEK